MIFCGALSIVIVIATVYVCLRIRIEELEYKVDSLTKRIDEEKYFTY